MWNEIHRRAELPPVDAATQATFDEGHEVGRLAQALFPGGREIAPGRFAWRQAVAETQAALAARVPLYEAAFSFDGAGCRVDVLAPVGADEWDLIEVKSSTSAKPVHVDDVAFQTWTLRAAGLRLRRSFVAHLDPEYVRHGELDLGRLFRLVDVGEAIEPLLPEVPRRLAALRGIEEQAEEPVVAIGPHCTDPYECPLKPRCWSHLPAESVFELHRGGARRWELHDDGVLALVEIPDEFELTEPQRIQVETARSGESHVDRAAVERFLSGLGYPLHFLDFESFGRAIPPFDGVRPYQQVPFQFSLHVVERPGEPARSVAYLAPDAEDRRGELLEALRRAIGPSGSIVAYNAGFEQRMLQECAGAVADHAAWVEALAGRFVDLLAPFRNFAWYHPAQHGSASMKAVLPALVGRGYDGLEIQEGSLAAREFLRSAAAETPADERQRIRAALLAYCGRDTEGMVEIVERLRQLAGD